MSDQSSGGWDAPNVGHGNAPPPPTSVPPPPVPPPPPPAPTAGGTTTWYPPGPGTSWDPGPGEPTSPLPETPDIPIAPTAPKRSKARVVGGIAGAAALLGAGTFAFVSMRDDASGGADSPEAAVEAFVAALNDEDVLGALDVLLPGERDTLKDPMVRLVSELQRIDVLDETADLSKVGGIDLQIDLTRTETAEVADDIVSVGVVGAASAVVDNERLPIGDLLVDEAFDGERPTGGADEETTIGSDDAPAPITTVERDGRWYVSLMYSIAEIARARADAGPVPAADQAVAAQGASSPQAAMDQFLDRAVALDLEGIIGALNPNEAEALQRYAPLFLPDANAAVDEMLNETGLELTIEDVKYDVEIDGDHAMLLPTSFTMRAAAEGDEVSMTYADGCVTMVVAGEEHRACEGDAEDQLDDFGFGGWSDLATGSGMRLDRVDGEWYVSPLGTAFDLLLGALEGVERADLEELIQGLEDGSVNPLEGIPGIGVSETDGSSAPTVETIVPAEDEATGDTFPDDPTMECYLEEDPADALECLLAARAGDSEVYISPAVEFPECGIARYSWRYAWDELDDATFIDTVTAANECFAAKVAAGELEDWEVPTEVLDPACYNGTNPYRIEDVDEQSAALGDYYDCAFA